MAGNFFSKFMSFLGMDEGYDGEFADEAEQRPSTTKRSPAQGEYVSRRSAPPSTIGSRRAVYDDAQDQPAHEQAAGTPGAVRMVVFQPQTYEDTQTIIDNLKSRKPVIVNLDSLNVEVGQRVLDFMSGAIYALDGSIRKVSKGIFLLAPRGVDISGNFASGLPGSIRGKNYFNMPNRTE